MQIFFFYFCIFILLGACTKKDIPLDVLSAKVFTCSNELNQNKLWNGIEQGAVEYQSVGALYVKQMNKFAYFCTATLIDKQIVITAAHCALESPNTLYFTLQSFSSGLQENTESISFHFTRIQKVEVHPQAAFVENENRPNGKMSVGPDIALLKLVSRFEGCDFPIISPLTVESGVGTIVGFGNTGSSSGKKMSLTENFLLGVMTDKSDGPLPFKKYDLSFPPNTGAICPGDSGSPLFANGQIMGITYEAIAPEGQDPNLCGKGTRGEVSPTSEYLAWILEAKNRLLQ